MRNMIRDTYVSTCIIPTYDAMLLGQARRYTRTRTYCHTLSCSCDLCTVSSLVPVPTAVFLHCIHSPLPPVRAEIDVSTFQDLYVVNEGQNVTFSCSAFGVPAPTISWRRDGVEFSPSSDSRVVLHSEVTTQVDYMGPVYQTMRMLTFTDVMDSDTRNIKGMMYQCVAVNTVGGSGSVEESEDVEDFTLFVRG